LKQSAPKTEIPFSTKLRAYLELMRPANIVTAFADILAGFAAAGGVLLFDGMIPSLSPAGVGWLLLSTFGLYGGGVVFNDFFDAELDAEERPERAIPSGRATPAGAAVLGSFLFFIGIYTAFRVGFYSGLIAVFITCCALLYDARAKHSSLWGPLLMGLCRGGNLLLGCSIIPSAIPELWFLALIPIVYIGSITLISQGEVHGGSKTSGISALGLIVIVTGGLLFLGYLPSYEILTTLPFVVAFGLIVIPPFAKAAFSPESKLIKKAVKRGVLSLIILNSAITAGFGGVIYGIIVLALLPLSIGLSKLFAVT
jgi:4-hydroxybenzoate polyprenyltransferase